MQTYINSLDMGNTPFLQELETKALADRVPIIRRDMQSFMRMLLALKQPKRILEVGTAVGFSTLLMCEYGPEDMEIVTIENYEKRIPVAKDNFRRAGRESQITLLEGDAGEILKNLTGTFDMIFMDAAKGQYIHWLPDVLRLMKEGSVLVSDNVLQEGDIIESHYLVERRNRTIYKRMREYLWQLTHSPVLRTSVLPLGDGAAVSVKTGENVYQLSASSGLDRTSLQRMITGKRLPGIDFVRQFCDSLRINPSQRRELMELYKIEKIGKEIYYNRKYIQELLGVISSQQVISREGFLRLPSFPFYRGTFSLDVEKKVLSLFEDILSSGSSETIRTNLPANCRLLVQIFSHLYPKYEKLPPVIQILPLHQNPSASPDYNMNLETFLCTLLQIGRAHV